MPRPNRNVYRRNLRDMVAKIKTQRGCEQAGCKERRAPALEFHHRKPGEKVLAVSDAISQDWPMARVLTETEKCVVICKNCHACQHSIYRNDGRRRKRPLV